MSLDIDNFNFIGERPITKFYQNIRDMNIPTMAYFLEHLIDIQCKDDNTLKFKSSELFGMFRDYIANSNISFDTNITRFGIDISNYEGIQKKKDGYIMIVIDKEQLKQFLIKKYALEFNSKNNNADFIEEEDHYNPLDM